MAENTHPRKSYYKLLRGCMKHGDHTYKPGINVLSGPFIPNIQEQEGGLFLCRFQDIPYWLQIYDDLEFIAPAYLGRTSNVIYGRRKVKTDFFIMGYPQFLWKFLEDNFNQIEILMRHPCNLRYYRYEQPLLMIEEAVKKEPHALQYALKPSWELCVEVVSKCPGAIRHIRPQNMAPEILYAAVCKNGLLLTYMLNQSIRWSHIWETETERICLAAVRQNGLALQFVKHKTLKICEAAVEQNGWALRYVPQQTYDLVRRAYMQNPGISELVDPRFRNLLEYAVSNTGSQRVTWRRQILFH